MSETSRLTCIVAGAGLGGLSAAIALRQAGHRVVVLEQAPALGVVGAGIQMAPNASRILGGWGVVDRFRDVGVPAEAAIRRRWQDGSVLGEVELGQAVLDRFGASYWCLHRADLHAALVAVATDPAGPGTPVELRLDTTVDGVVAAGPDQARIRTVDGRVITGDVVIGADGIRSAVRRSLFGPIPATFSGRVTNRHLIDAGPFRDDPVLGPLIARPAQNIWLGPNGHVIVHPIRGGAGLYMGVTRAGIADEDAFWSIPVDKQQLLDELSGWDPTIGRLIEATPSITGYGLHDSEPIPEWTVDRIALLGDACHPMLPFQAQGAAQAVEDAAVLGSVLTGISPEDVPAALARYAALRQPRAARVQAASRANARLWHMPDGPEQESRDAGLAEGGADFESYRWLWAAGPDGVPLAGVGAA